MRWIGAAVAALTVALAVGGCECSESHRLVHGFAPTASYRAAIAVCLAGGDCRPLCVGAFGLDADTWVERCHVSALVRPDATTLPAPIDPATDIGSMSGANLTVVYVHTDGCDPGGAAGVVYDDDGGGGGDDTGCDGACDGDPGDEMDDGGDPGDDDSGDDDGGGDGGDDGSDDGGDDGGGDDGRRPPPATAQASRAADLATRPDPVHRVAVSPGDRAAGRRR